MGKSGTSRLHAAKANCVASKSTSPAEIDMTAFRRTPPDRPSLAGIPKLLGQLDLFLVSCLISQRIQRWRCSDGQQVLKYAQQCKCDQNRNACYPDDRENHVHGLLTVTYPCTNIVLVRLEEILCRNAVL